MPQQRHPQLTTFLILLLLFEFLSCSLVVVDASSMAITHKLDPMMMRMLYGQMVKRIDDNLQVCSALDLLYWAVFIFRG